MIFWWAIACSTAGYTFAQDRADAQCAWHDRCGTLEDAGFDDLAACQTALQDAVDHERDLGALSCEGFDADAADACLALYADNDCVTTPDLSVCDTVCTE